MGAARADCDAHAIQEQVMKNLTAVVEASGSKLSHVVKTTVCESCVGTGWVGRES